MYAVALTCAVPKDFICPFSEPGCKLEINSVKRRLTGDELLVLLQLIDGLLCDGGGAPRQILGLPGHADPDLVPQLASAGAWKGKRFSIMRTLGIK